MLQKGSQCGNHEKGVDQEKAGVLLDSEVYTVQDLRGILRTRIGNKCRRREEKPSVIVLTCDHSTGGKDTGGSLGSHTCAHTHRHIDTDTDTKRHTQRCTDT